MPARLTNPVIHRGLSVAANGYLGLSVLLDTLDCKVDSRAHEEGDQACLDASSIVHECGRLLCLMPSSHHSFPTVSSLHLASLRTQLANHGTAT